MCVCVSDLLLTERYYQNLWLKTDINGTFSWDRVLFLHTPGNIQEDDALKLQLLDLGCEIRPVTLPIKKENNYREEHQVNNGKVSRSRQVLSKHTLSWEFHTHHHPDVLGQVPGAPLEEVRESRLRGQNYESHTLKHTLTQSVRQTGTRLTPA